ncbi:hypothetical protein ACFFRR_007399 [Megaselia abdita]
MNTNKNIIVIKLLVVYFLQINLLECVPSPFFEHIEGVSSRTVNMNNQKERESILNQFNLTEEEFDRAKHNMAYNITPARASTPETWTAGANYSKKGARQEQVIDKIKDLRSEVVTNSITTTKIYPICPQHNNEQAWYGEYNQTIRFGDSSINLNINENPIDTVLLHMYKIPVEDNAGGIDICNRKFYYRQIRVTISVHAQSDSKKQRERKKIVCSTMMVPYVHEGWIEMDVQRAIYTWKTTTNTNNHFKLFLEVHDEENVLLKPGDFFMPMRCLHRSNNKRYNVSLR